MISLEKKAKKMNIENNINYSEDFRYPIEDGEDDELHLAVSSTDIIIRFSNILFSSKKPKVTLAALLYGSGMDVGIYLNVENTESAISKVLGESQQNFHALINKMRKEFNLHHTNTGKSPDKRDNYKKANYRKT